MMQHAAIGKAIAPQIARVCISTAEEPKMVGNGSASSLLPRNPMPSSVFVYGTLKRGQCREHLWPLPPRSIQIGWSHGRLFGRHDYPAMTPGNDRVIGELWEFDESAIEIVLPLLDQIEGTNQPGQTDLYCRVVTDVYAAEDDGCLGQAWTYHYATDPETNGFTRIEQQPARWP